MRRGMRKFSVTAAHSVTTKNPSRRRTNLISRASCRLNLRLRLQVQEHDAPVGVDVGGRSCERVALRDPAGQAAGVVLVPVDALGHRYHWDLVDHRLLEL